jgi:flagellar biosynthetic protein FliO
MLLEAASSVADVPGQELTSQDSQAAMRLPLRFVRAEATAADAASPTASSWGHALPLAPPKSKRGANDSSHRPPTAGRAVTTVTTSLAVVLGVFALLAWLARKANAKGRAMLPGNVLETLGRARLNARQEMHLVRVGNKLILLAVTPTSAETLTEITDPAEIDRLAGICRQDQADSITASFREVLSQYASR